MSFMITINIYGGSFHGFSKNHHKSPTDVHRAFWHRLLLLDTSTDDVLSSDVFDGCDAKEMHAKIWLKNMAQESSI